MQLAERLLSKRLHHLLAKDAALHLQCCLSWLSQPCPSAYKEGECACRSLQKIPECHWQQLLHARPSEIMGLEVRHCQPLEAADVPASASAPAWPHLACMKHLGRSWLNWLLSEGNHGKGHLRYHTLRRVWHSWVRRDVEHRRLRLHSNHPCTLRDLQVLPKVLAKCMLKYCRISECLHHVGTSYHVTTTCLATAPCLFNPFCECCPTEASQRGILLMLSVFAQATRAYCRWVEHRQELCQHLAGACPPAVVSKHKL